MIRRPTTRDIAKLAGVAQSTVSYALRDYPRLPLATRRKIQAIAKKLNYQPDPMLSAISVYRQGIKPRRYRGMLAWIENHPTRDGCKKIATFKDYFLGASERAKELGYTLETFWLRSPKLSRHRIHSTLRSRNVQGLLIAPQPRGRARLRLEWDQFPVVAMGYSLVRPQFHVVSGNSYMAMIQTMRRLYALGYRRIGFVTTTFHAESVAQNQFAAFLVEQKRVKMDDQIPALILDSKKEDFPIEPEFLPWYEQYTPQVVIATFPEIFAALKKMGQKVPKDTGFVWLNMPSRVRNFSGMNMNARLIGKVAVNYLVSMVHHHERNIPKVPQRLLVEGTWVEGKTVRRINVI